MCIFHHLHVLRCEVRPPLVAVAWNPALGTHSVAVDSYSKPLGCEILTTCSVSDPNEPERQLDCHFHPCCASSYDILPCACLDRSSADENATVELLAHNCPCRHDYYFYSQLGGSDWPQLPVLDGWIKEIPLAPTYGQAIPGVKVYCTPEEYRLERGSLIETAKALRLIIPIAVGVSPELATKIHAL